jgi:hypothetical protein
MWLPGPTLGPPATHQEKISKEECADWARNFQQKKL